MLPAMVWQKQQGEINQDKDTELKKNLKSCNIQKYSNKKFLKTYQTQLTYRTFTSQYSLCKYDNIQSYNTQRALYINVKYANGPICD